MRPPFYWTSDCTHCTSIHCTSTELTEWVPGWLSSYLLIFHFTHNDVRMIWKSQEEYPWTLFKDVTKISFVFIRVILNTDKFLYMLEFRNLYTHDGIFKLIRLLYVYLFNFIFQVKTQAASLTFGLS